MNEMNEESFELNGFMSVKLSTLGVHLCTSRGDRPLAPS